MMLDEDDVLGSGFLDTGASNYLLGSQSLQQTFTSPLFGVGDDDDENPWGGGFDPVADIRQSLSTTTTAVDNNIVGDDLTAANVLVGVDLPEIYDTAYVRAGPVDNRLSVVSLENVIRLSGLSPRVVEEVIHIVVPASALHVTRNEFNTSLALIGCAQKNMELSLETVYHHRNDLPVPVLPRLDDLHVKREIPAAANETAKPVEDPWAPPPKPRKVIEVTKPVNGTKPNIANTIKAVTSVHPANGNHHIVKPSSDDPKPSIENLKWFQDVDQVKVTLAPEKEGFIFKHVNYVVESQLRSSIVSRRYSDFYWLWEMLLKRYPFRVIPNLPPKKLGGGDLFLEKRRKGLARFINNVIRHPCLKKDEVVNTFLTEPSELLAWRRANPPTTDEEFIRKAPNTDELEGYIPSDLDDRLVKLQRKLPKIVGHYSTMCLVMERMIRLTEAHGTEYVRYSITLNAMSELEQDCYVSGCQGCGSVVRGYEAVAKHMQRAGSILDDQASASIHGVLENIKRQRDIFISFKEMLERKSKLATNQIDSLAKKLEANKAKVNQNRGVPGLEAEVERLDAAIHADYERMTYQQRRHIYIRYCLTSELSFLHKQQAFVSHLYQDFVHEQVQLSRNTIENWKALQVLTCDRLEPDEFV
ncbi:Sorting nexin mvp1 [Apophysomyces sp. BC1034]|nr:Sorting nexin mvp1 [Apophysomyces sp. BC1015]KAG0180389.1 Sorting nexin mvp1 [Apophysomyces sp. BC1021]KAG0190942.1 Sorting nexin mvp1 [Apophysomyces sp. BC1034]